MILHGSQCALSANMQEVFKSYDLFKEVLFEDISFEVNLTVVCYFVYRALNFWHFFWYFFSIAGMTPRQLFKGIFFLYHTIFYIVV